MSASSSGGRRVLWSCASVVQCSHIGGSILVHRESSPRTSGIQSLQRYDPIGASVWAYNVSYGPASGVGPMVSGLWQLECPSG